MKLGKILHKLNGFFDENQGKKIKSDESLSKLLKKLRKEEKRLKEDLSAELDVDEKGQLKQELEIIHRQRKKGIALLAEIRVKKQPDSD